MQTVYVTTFLPGVVALVIAWLTFTAIRQRREVILLQKRRSTLLAVVRTDSSHSVASVGGESAGDAAVAPVLVLQANPIHAKSPPGQSSNGVTAVGAGVVSEHSRTMQAPPHSSTALKGVVKVPEWV